MEDDTIPPPRKISSGSLSIEASCPRCQGEEAHKPPEEIPCSLCKGNKKVKLHEHHDYLFARAIAEDSCPPGKLGESK